MRNSLKMLTSRRMPGHHEELVITKAAKLNVARFEKPRIRRERAQIGQVGPVKLAFLIFRSCYLNVHALL